MIQRTRWQDAIFTARIEQWGALEIPEGGVICDLGFDFDAVDPSLQQDIEYDDNFLLTFNDVVLATSYGPIIEEFELEDGLPIYEWSRMQGEDLSFTDIPTWCLGEEEGDSTCTIPPPETTGTIALSFAGELVDRLSLRAVEERSYQFGFITTGDNDDTDCIHEEFSFTVTAPVVQL